MKILESMVESSSDGSNNPDSTFFLLCHDPPNGLIEVITILVLKQLNFDILCFVMFSSLFFKAVQISNNCLYLYRRIELIQSVGTSVNCKDFLTAWKEQSD